MSFERANAIEKLEGDLSHKDKIIVVLTNEIESSRKAKIETSQRAEEIMKSMEEMRKTHMDLVQEMRHHNTVIMRERDAVLKGVAELKAKLTEALKEKDEANKMA